MHILNRHTQHKKCFACTQPKIKYLKWYKFSHFTLWVKRFENFKIYCGVICLLFTILCFISVPDIHIRWPFDQFSCPRSVDGRWRRHHTVDSFMCSYVQQMLLSCHAMPQRFRAQINNDWWATLYMFGHTTNIRSYKRQIANRRNKNKKYCGHD